MKEKLHSLGDNERYNSDLSIDEEPNSKEGLLEQISKTEQRQLKCLTKQT
jgi:hypothetical protein